MTLLFYNALIYIIAVVILYLHYKRTITVGIFLLGIYAFSAVSSYFLFIHPSFRYSPHYSTMTLEPLVYLFCVLFLFFLPILQFNNNVVKEIVFFDRQKYFVLLYIFLFFISTAIMASVPDLVKGVSGNIALNRDFATETDINSKHSSIVSIILRISSALYYISIFWGAFGLIFIKEKRWVIKIFFAVSVLAPLVESLSNTARTGFIFEIFYLIFLFILFRNFVSPKIRKRLVVSGAVLGSIFLAIVVTISVLRFANHEFLSLDFFLLKYAGENFINFDGLLYDKTKGFANGYQSFPFFRRMLGLEYFKNITEKRNFIENKVGVLPFIYYFFVGSLYMDFGPILTFAIGLVIAIFIPKLVRSTPSIPFYRYILLIFFFNLCSEGLFYFSNASEPGNLRIVLHFVLYLYFRIKKGHMFPS